MTSMVQPERSLSENPLFCMRSNFVYLRQHFPTKEIYQERETKQSKKSFLSTENLRHGEDSHALSMGPQKTQSMHKSRSCNSFVGDLIEKNSSMSMTDKERHSVEEILTHSDFHKTTALESLTACSERLKQYDAAGTVHSEYLTTTHHNGDIKHPLTNSLGIGVIRPIQVTHASKSLSNEARNTTHHLKDACRESRSETYTEYGFDKNRVDLQNDGKLAENQVMNSLNLPQITVVHNATKMSNARGPIYDRPEDHMATDPRGTDFMASSCQSITENESLKHFNSENNGARGSYIDQETYVTVRNSSYQNGIECDKASGNNSNHSQSQDANNKDVTKQGFTGVEAHSQRRVIRVISLKDKDFLSRAKRNITIGQISKSHSSSVRHEKTPRSSKGGDVPPNTQESRSGKTQEIIPQPKIEKVGLHVNGRQSRMATFEEVSRKSENRVRVEVNVSLQPQNSASHELSRIEKEILTLEEVQGKDQLDSGTVKLVPTENESLTSLESEELGTNTKIIESQWKSSKIDNEKQYVAEEQVAMHTHMAVKLVTEAETQISNVDIVKELTRSSRNNHFLLDYKSDVLPITDAMYSKCFNETQQSNDNENTESLTQIYKISNHHNESFARKDESSGGFENLHEAKKEINHSFADTAREEDNREKSLQSVTMTVEKTSHARPTEKGRDGQDKEPPSTVKREVQVAEKYKSSRRVRRAMTISTTNEEIAEALKQFSEVSTDPEQRKDDRTQLENNMDTAGQSCKDSVQSSGGPHNDENSLGSEKSDEPKRNHCIEPRRRWRLPVRRPLSRSNTVITDDRDYLKQLSEEIRTMLILDARQRKMNADKTQRRNRINADENQLTIDTERESRLSNKLSEDVIYSRQLDSIDILKLETLPLDDRDIGNDEIDKTREVELKEATSTKPTEVHPVEETSCDHEPIEVTDSVVVHEFSELISASTPTEDPTHIGGIELNRSSEYLYESGDMLSHALRGMVILAASEQYMKLVEAHTSAEYEALRRRPRKDGKVFLPRRSLHQNSLPENDTHPLI